MLGTIVKCEIDIGFLGIYLEHSIGNGNRNWAILAIRFFLITNNFYLLNRLIITGKNEYNTTDQAKLLNIQLRELEHVSSILGRKSNQIAKLFVV
jgi:hypothetical protein